MPASIGVNLRVTGHCSQGGRKYMEDLFSVAYQQTEDERDLEYAFFGIYDGHGGSEAAAFAKEHLMDSIVKQRQFWSDNDEDVLKAIRNGYMLTHMNMWKELEKWPKTVTGLPSTAGTTASIAFIRRGKIYIGHVGDSAIVLGYQKDGSEEWAAKPLTLDHKPESSAEMERIARCGGKVISKAGVPRVVWNRPRPGHKGPIKKNTPMDEIPFLAVARSLGDLWSYNTHNDEFVVSPDPDVGVLTIDPSKFRCLIFGTDGLWNMISPEGAVTLVQATERHNEAALVGGTQPKDWLNPSKSLVDHALERWSNTRMRADNTSVVTLMLDPPGPPRATVLRSRSTAARPPPQPVPEPEPAKLDAPDPPRQLPQNGLTIMTRYSDDKPIAPVEDAAAAAPLPPCSTLDGRYSLGVRDRSPAPPVEDADAILNYGNPTESYFMARLLNRSRVVNTLSDVFDEIVRAASPPTTDLPPEVPSAKEPDEEPVPEAGPAGDDGGIQINEVSSSSPHEGPPKRGRKPRPDGKPAPDNDRVLRSHDADASPRPHTRQTRQRPPPPPALDRVVILSRRAPPPPPPPPVDAKPPKVEERADEIRRTRSQHATPLAQKISRSFGAVARELRGAGNSTGAATAAARRDCAKENRGAAMRRGARAAPAPASRPRRAEPRPDDEVHSTTPPLPPPPLPPALCARALRSRNETEAPRTAMAGKRARCGSEGAAPHTHKAPKLGGERAARALQRRAAGPWAPALALRNRLRKRLAK